MAQADDWRYETAYDWYKTYEGCGVAKYPNQSPINIVKREMVQDTTRVPLESEYWGRYGLKLVNTGMQLQMDGNWGYFEHNKIKYYSKTVKFHQPSEHTFDGMRYWW